jgi:hypothetical protein
LRNQLLLAVRLAPAAAAAAAAASFHVTPAYKTVVGAARRPLAANCWISIAIKIWRVLAKHIW